jgi:selenoprotein W-related protein
MAELLQEYEAEIQSVALVPSDGGRYEITVNGTLLYSKLQTGEHVEPNEVVKLLRAHLGRK